MLTMSDAGAKPVFTHRLSRLERFEQIGRRLEVLDELGMGAGFEVMSAEDAEFMIDLMDTLLS